MKAGSAVPRLAWHFSQDGRISSATHSPRAEVMDLRPKEPPFAGDHKPASHAGRSHRTSRKIARATRLSEGRVQRLTTIAVRSGQVGACMVIRALKRQEFVDRLHRARVGAL